jgi:CubicO group peptidase (beta-lactamase class C family)
VKNPSAKILALIQVLLLVAGPAVGQSTGSTTKQDTPTSQLARKLIKDRMAAESIPSFSVAVARKGKILWEESFGWADRENKVPATAHTPYYLASVTKSITATAIMVLHERKQLDIDRQSTTTFGLRDSAVHSGMLRMRPCVA